MSNFDPITFSAVNKLKAPVGSLMMVPDGFTSDKYLDTGASFDTNVYADLAAAFPNSKSSEITATAVQLPVNPSSYDITYAKMGNVIGVYTINSAPDNYYVLFSNGRVFVSVAGASPVFYKQLFAPSGAAAQISSANFFSSALVNNRLYVGGTGGTSVYYETYYIDLLQDFATVAVTVPRNTFNWRSAFTRFRAATGKYIAIGSPPNFSSQMTVCTSDDGVNFTQIATGITAVNPTAIVAFAGNSTTWVVSTNTAAVWTSADGITWTSRTASAMAHLVYADSLGLFVGASYTAGGSLYTSPDGITWTARAQGAPACALGFTKLLVNGSDLIAITSTQQTQYSSNGTSWSARNLTNPLFYGNLFYTTFSNTTSNYLLNVGAVIQSFDAQYQTQKLQTATYNVAPDLASVRSLSPYGNCSNVGAPFFTGNGSLGCAFENVSSYTGTSISGYFTRDSGKTWSTFVYRFDDSKPITFLVSRGFANDGIIYIVISSSSGTQLLYSSDGTNWYLSTNINLTGILSFIGHKNSIYAITSNGVFVSNDNCLTWAASTSYTSGQVFYASNTNAGFVNLTGTSASIMEVNAWRTNTIGGLTGATLGSVAANASRMIAVNQTNGVLYELKADELVHNTIQAPLAKFAQFQLVDNAILAHQDGYALMSDDNVNWKTVKILDGVKFSSISSINSWCSIGNVLYKLSAIGKNGKIPKVASTVPGSKWVVRAKK